jgi:hypothetical protein
MPAPSNTKLTKATTTKQASGDTVVSVSGNVSAKDVSPDTNQFETDVVVLSFVSVSNPGVNYSFSGALAGIDTNGINSNIRLPAAAGIPSGQYYLTVQTQSGIKSILVNIG